MLMSSWGQLAAYKVVTKQIDYRHIVDYFMCQNLIVQCWESLSLAHQSHSEQPGSSQSERLEFETSSLKMLRVLELDQYFNLKDTNEEGSSSGKDFDKFSDDLLEIIEEH